MPTIEITCSHCKALLLRKQLDKLDNCSIYETGKDAGGFSEIRRREVMPPSLNI